MATIRLINASGRTIMAGEPVKLHPTKKNSFDYAVLGDIVIGHVAENKHKGSWTTINLLGSNTGGVTSYNDLTDKPTIPDQLSDLSQDATHRVTTDTEKAIWNDKISDEYETISKNLKSYPYVITYGVDGIDTITYDLGGGLSIVKTFNYTLGVLTSIVLSGDTPSGIELTKTLIYTGVDLTSVTYS